MLLALSQVKSQVAIYPPINLEQGAAEYYIKTLDLPAGRAGVWVRALLQQRKLRGMSARALAMHF